MGDFKNNIYSNIKYLAKEKGIKISELENPHPPGYISLLEKLNHCYGLPIGFVYEISQTLGFSIDDLIEEDLSGAYELKKVREEIKRLQIIESNILAANTNLWGM